MCGGYTLEWLDSLTTVSLNPAKTDLNAILPEQITYLRSRIGEEKTLHQSFLNNKVFTLLEEKKINILINQYHAALIILLDQAFKNQKKIPAKETALKQLANELTACLDELLSFIEARFSNYLSLDGRVPVTYLSVAKKELKQRLDKLKPKLGQISDKQVTDIVLQSLYSFTNRAKYDHPVTFQEVLYKKELLKRLEALGASEGEAYHFTDLNELLVYMNFNSKAFMNYFTQGLAEKINAHENISDRMDKLLFHFKEFNQMRRKPGVILNPRCRDLKTELGNWFTQEIFYLEKKLHWTIVPLNGNAEQRVSQTVPTKNEPQKISCNLSVDQMALALRSAGDLEIILSRSLNAVFKTIVPHLATPYQENISWDSMRSKSYVAETRDKEIVIQALEQMIKKIREY